MGYASLWFIVLTVLFCFFSFVEIISMIRRNELAAMDDKIRTQYLGNMFASVIMMIYGISLIVGAYTKS